MELNQLMEVNVLRLYMDGALVHSLELHLFFYLYLQGGPIGMQQL